MRNFDIVKKSLGGLALLAASLLPINAWSHGGASVDTDQCRVQIGSHLVHFTAYQPQLTGTTEYCNAIPELGQATVVFDYEGKALRNMTVEFEITKEPEGTRVFYQPPSTHPNGTFNANINFTEAGKYRVHVTLVNEGQKVDEHIGFVVGAGAAGVPTSTIVVILTLLIAGGYIFYLSNAGFKNVVDKLITKKQA
ncbi:MAG: FixH family protein [Methylococcus sp.]